MNRWRMIAIAAVASTALIVGAAQLWASGPAGSAVIDSLACGAGQRVLGSEPVGEPETSYASPQLALASIVPALGPGYRLDGFKEVQTSTGLSFQMIDGGKLTGAVGIVPSGQGWAVGDYYVCSSSPTVDQGFSDQTRGR